MRIVLLLLVDILPLTLDSFVITDEDDLRRVKEAITIIETGWGSGWH